MGRHIWSAVIGALGGILVALVQYVLAPLVTQPQLKAAIEASRPIWRTFDELNTDKNTSQELGRWDICTLSVAGTVHNTQACTCELKPTDGKWKLRVALDETGRGLFCRCQASCVNFKQSG